MGVFTTHIRVANLHDRAQAREIEFVVDTGATLTKLSEDLLTELQIAPQFSLPALTSDNREVLRRIGLAWVNINGRSGAVPVAFGNRGEPVLLGATTLGILGLTVDPVEQKLVPRPLLEK
ncbi:MAG TPA: aspartyl protease family protein [Candidatus Binatia bacterium]|jgi:predicted aspartyl protease|nr:aspartyl protease family protein [Candidatus Binatia bacterium]